MIKGKPHIGRRWGRWIVFPIGTPGMYVYWSNLRDALDCARYWSIKGFAPA